jgi:hypothetical protein
MEFLFSIIKKKNYLFGFAYGTVRYGTLRYGIEDKFGSPTVYSINNKDKK